jgi:hypothetical protein
LSFAPQTKLARIIADLASSEEIQSS